MKINLFYKSVLRNNRGSSLIQTIGFISFISLLSISAVTTTTSGLKSAGVFNNNQTAYYNAQAGLEYATYYVKTLGVCRTYQLRKKWLPNLRFKTVKTFLNSLIPYGSICCYNRLILFK